MLIVSGSVRPSRDTQESQRMAEARSITPFGYRPLGADGDPTSDHSTSVGSSHYREAGFAAYPRKNDELRATQHHRTSISDFVSAVSGPSLRLFARVQSFANLKSARCAGLYRRLVLANWLRRASCGCKPATRQRAARKAWPCIQSLAHRWLIAASRSPP
jgi:hypothetical protein